MDNVNRAKGRALALALVFTFLFPVGGVLLGVGLGFGWPAMWGIGIACLACGFYGCPLTWVSYGNVRGLWRVVSAVVEENLYTVREIASQLGMPEKEIRNRLDACFKKRYLPGYKKDGDGVTLNENAPLAEEERTAVCAACGARFTYKRGEKPACPYCGTPAGK